MKKCQYCAEEIQDAAVLCRHCGRDLMVIAAPAALATAGAVSLEQRRNILARAIQTQLIYKPRIESQSDTQAVLVFGKPPNHLLHFLIGLFTLGVWWIVWLVLALSNKETRRMISVDEYGAMTSQDY
jgi:hypothetical protein